LHRERHLNKPLKRVTNKFLKKVEIPNHSNKKEDNLNKIRELIVEKAKRRRRETETKTKIKVEKRSECFMCILI
jgi:hypothetical protein